MRERTVRREVKKTLRDSIIVLIVAYASETWIWNQSQRYKIQGVKMSYLRGGCGVYRMDVLVMRMYTENLVCPVEEKE